MSPKAKTAAAAGANGAESETAAPAPGEKGYTPFGKIVVLAERIAGKFVHRVVSDAKHVWKDIVDYVESKKDEPKK